MLIAYSKANTPATIATAKPTTGLSAPAAAAEDSPVADADADDEVPVAVAVARVVVPEEDDDDEVVIVALLAEPEPVVTGAAAAVVDAAAEGEAVAEKSAQTAAPADWAWVSSAESQAASRQSTAARPMSLVLAQAHWGLGG